MKVILFILLFLSSFSGYGQTKYQKDFQQFWKMLEAEYAYFHQKQTDWNKVKTIYQSIADSIQNRTQFIELLDQLILELYDPHISLNTNANSSFQLIPSNADMWVSYSNGHYTITDIRENYSAEAAGLKIGMEVIAVDGVPIQDAVKNILPKSFDQPKANVYEYLGNLVVAGNRVAKRSIRVKSENQTLDIVVGTPRRVKTLSVDQGLVGSKIIDGTIGYIKINNSLGNNNLIPQIDSIVDAMSHTKSIILDLRDTPGGGNTTVARAIMGKFTTKEVIYQKHIYPWEQRTFGIKRSWDEYVSPNGKHYRGKLIVLVGYWTGSVGEAIAIGLDSFKKPKVVGTQMARLLGAIYCYRLQETNINVCFPAEQLFHVNGTPREAFIPPFNTTTSKATYLKGLQLAK